MKFIYVINAGSSTWKTALFPAEDRALSTPQDPLWRATLEKEQANYSVTISVPEKKTIGLKAPTFAKAIEQFLKMPFPKLGKLTDVVAVGHRIVHGGKRFIQPTLLTQKVIKGIASLNHLAPLHNPLNLEGVEFAKKCFPKAKQIGVFDTAFHSTLPPENYTYPVPLDWLKKGIRRYGFHGISHRSCYERLLQLVGKKCAKEKIITCHLGNGASLAAILNGKSIDTTMGFTPMEGLMMGTRSGSIDPGIPFYLLRHHTYTPVELENCLNRDSGLKAISGTNDMRDVILKMKKGNKNATLAFQMFCHILAKEIAAMAASLKGLDRIVFTGGIGEHSKEVREETCKQLGFLGIDLDSSSNPSIKEGKISTSKSPVKIYVIPSREDWIIAKDAFKH